MGINLDTGQLTSFGDVLGQVSDIRISPSQKYFAVLDEVSNLNLYNIDGTLVKSFDANTDFEFTFSQDNRFFIIKDDNAYYSLWPLEQDYLKIPQPCQST